MKAKEFGNFCDTLYNDIEKIYYLSDEERKNAHDVLALVEKFAEIEADRGAEGSYVIKELFDNNLKYDGKCIIPYAENLLGYEINPTEKDIENAKFMWFVSEIEFLIDDYKLNS